MGYNTPLLPGCMTCNLDLTGCNLDVDVIRYMYIGAFFNFLNMHLLHLVQLPGIIYIQVYIIILCAVSCTTGTQEDVLPVNHTDFHRSRLRCNVFLSPIPIPVPIPGTCNLSARRGARPPQPRPSTTPQINHKTHHHAPSRLASRSTLLLHVLGRCWKEKESKDQAYQQETTQHTNVFFAHGR